MYVEVTIHDFYARSSLPELARARERCNSRYILGSSSNTAFVRTPRRAIEIFRGNALAFPEPWKVTAPLGRWVPRGFRGLPRNFPSTSGDDDDDDAESNGAGGPINFTGKSRMEETLTAAWISSARCYALLINSLKWDTSLALKRRNTEGERTRSRLRRETSECAIGSLIYGIVMTRYTVGVWLGKRELSVCLRQVLVLLASLMIGPVVSNGVLVTTFHAGF